MIHKATIIITGAGSGIGRATVIAFLRRGYRVALIGRRKEALRETVTISGTSPDNDSVLVIPCDVTDPVAVETAFDNVVAKWNRLDVLFNNAGVSRPSMMIDELSVADWQEVLGVNTSGSFYCARKAFALMRRQKPQGGRIINNGSISASVPRPGSVAYTMSKHAITGLTRCLSLDGRVFNIACSQIDIGNAATDMVSSMKRGVPQADGSVRSEPLMDVRHVADSVLSIAELPLSANVQFMTLVATAMPFIGRG